MMFIDILVILTKLGLIVEYHPMEKNNGVASHISSHERGNKYYTFATEKSNQIQNSNIAISLTLPLIVSTIY